MASNSWRTLPSASPRKYCVPEAPDWVFRLLYFSVPDILVSNQLLNTGCRITSIQKFLGHKELSSTMVYARVHDQTVADDYYTAMEKVEKRLELLGAPEEVSAPIEASERQQLLALAVQLALPEVSAEARLSIASQMQILLVGKEMAWEEPPINDYGRKQW
ncbi:MAG: hypothetical protein P8Z00_23885 [Anaerolineales bacterium]